MKHIIILGDGMADWPVKSLGDKTLLQYAKTPYMDKLARMGRNGRLITVAEGFHPGSEVANMSVLGYNLPKVYEGRGPLEAASIGVDLQPGEMAMRCNLICVEGEILKNHSSGHISTEEADVLIQYLQEKLGNDRVRFHTGVQYRHLLVIKGGNKELDCTPPHDVPLKPFRPLMVKPLAPEAQETADLVNDLILKSQELLKNHPLNLKRMAEGKDPANSIWPWSPGYRPQMPTFSETFPPNDFFEGSLDDFWKRVPSLDADFEARRQVLEKEHKHWRFVAKLEDGKASVGLQEVGANHPFYGLEGSNNIILLTTERYKEYPMMIQGYGAGAGVTAAGVFADIMSIANV